MNVYELKTPRELLTGNSYAGRGIVIGKTPDPVINGQCHRTIDTN